MKFRSIIVILLLILQGCSTTTEKNTTTPPPVKADRPVRVIPLKPSDFALSMGITAENYPIIDGSTSTFPLVQGVYTKMFRPMTEGSHPIFPMYLADRDEVLWGYEGIPETPSQTMPSYEKLIAGEVDLILVPDPSEEAKRKAAAAGVELEYIPVGVEALVFITPSANPVADVTIEQLVQIYADMTIANWSALGGEDRMIIPICRNRDSGSHAQMENLVLRGKTTHPTIEKKYRSDDMPGMIARVTSNYYQLADDVPENIGRPEINALVLGYTLFYYLQDIQAARGPHPWRIKTLAINGIAPTPETIASKEYPLTMSYFAVIRKNEPADSPARKIVHWLTSDEGQRVVLDAGLGVVRPVKD